ncbi:MAG: helix-turn-helix transcriptional regulator [Lachnospiraceae bacterium]|nr:helix-turn-helix transcriptional regulator [Lachnospiraceae bacterium]
MGKNIGEVIRELRKRENITQEKLAEALNVSFQSISRWENNLAYPDISLIPAMANFFNVTTDILFDMNNEEHCKSKERYEEMYKEYRKNGDLDLCKDAMLDARKQFPRDHHFMMNLAETMDLYEKGTKAQKEEYISAKFSNQIYTLCQNVLEESRDEIERCRAVKLLCEHHVKAGNTSAALQLTKGIAKMEHCREFLLEQILSGTEKKHQLQKNMLEAVDYVATTMVKIAFQKEYGFTQDLSVDERIQYVETANKLYFLLMPDGNYQFYHRIVGWNYRRLAELYLLKNNMEKVYECLLSAEKEAAQFDELNTYKYTSIFVDSLEYNPNEYFKCWSGSERAMLLYRVNEMKDYFQEHKGIMELIERLKRATEKEKAVEIE